MFRFHDKSVQTVGIGLLAGLLAACGGSGNYSEPDDPSPPPPTVGDCADASFLAPDGHPRTWALLRQILQEVLVYGLTSADDTWYEQVFTSYSLVRWEEDASGSLVQTEELCSVDLSEFEVTIVSSTALQDIVVPERLIDSVPEADWPMTLEMEGDEESQCAVYELSSSDYVYMVWGAHVDPLNGECPEDPDAGAWYDQDGDEHMGVTFEIYRWEDDDWEPFADSYMCQRLLFKSEPGTVYWQGDGRYQVSAAMTSVTNDQSQYDASAFLLQGQDPEVRWSPNDFTYYVMVNIPDGSTCGDVTSEVFSWGE